MSKFSRGYMDIRIAKIEDSVGVHAFYCDLLKENIPYIRDNPTPTLEQETSFIQTFIQGAGDLLLAFNGREVVGMLGMQRSLQAHHRIQIGLSVKKQFRGNGLGGMLLKRAESWAKENSISSIELEVIVGNPAIKLYKSLCYEETGRVINGFERNNKYHDIICMQYRLTEENDERSTEG